MAIFLGVLIALIAIAVTYIKWNYQYWKRHNLPYFEPKFLRGNFGNPFRRKEPLSFIIRRLYNDVRAQKWKHAGMYEMIRPFYMPVDLDYVKNILTKDFQYFVDRGIFYNEKDDPLSAHLFSLGGKKWRNLRMKLTPTFTSGKMKMMFNTLLECEKNMHEFIKKSSENQEPIDIKEVIGCFTTDIIGSCAFGLDCNTFTEEDSPFRKYGKKVFTSTSKLRILKFVLMGTFPTIAKLLHFKLTDPEVSAFFIKVVKDTVAYREKNNVTRNDFMQLLIDLKNNNNSDDTKADDGTSLSIEQIAAQSFIFFLAGFETSSTTSAFALYELSRHQDIQDKLRDEITRVLKKHDGKITYDAIQEMKYMNQVIDETLRKYPAVPVLRRQATKDYKVPDEDVIIKKGISVMIPVLGIHYDPEYYPEPEKFDPERFSDKMKASRHPYAHLPFGEGPRNCIGLRFGVMQTKVGLTTLLKNYKFTVSNKTQEPIKFKPNAFIPAVEGEIWLNAEKISE